MTHANDARAPLFPSLSRMCRHPVLPESASSAESPLSKSLHNAVREGDVRTLMSLIKQGAPLNLRATTANWTALHVAAALNNAVAIAVLLRHGADPDTHDIDGDTPLITAASVGHTEAVQQLLAKADLMLTSRRGESALHAAAEAGFDDIASLLIARGGARLVNARTCDGYTARDLAKEHTDIVEMINAHKLAANRALTL